MSSTKNSKQRTAIYEFLLSRTDHPTADFIYQNIRKDFPNISLATVYRNLIFLVDHDMAIRVPCSDGSEHFDANMMPHFHFQCNACGAILDLNFNCMDLQNELYQSASKNFTGLIKGSRTYFYGLCPSCMNKKGN